MAPEYAHHGHFSTKVDVFSYGVLTLEIVTGRQSSSVYDSGHAEDFLDYVSMSSYCIICFCNGSLYIIFKKDTQDIVSMMNRIHMNTNKDARSSKL